MLMHSALSLLCFGASAHINRALSSQRDLQALQHPLQNSTIHIIIEDASTDLFISFLPQRVEFSLSHAAMPIVATIQGKLSTFLGMIKKIRSKAAVDYDGLQVEGNTQLLQQTLYFFEYAMPSLEEILADWIGDTPSMAITTPLKKWRAFKKTVWHSFSQNLTEYIQEEKKYAPSPFAVNAFSDALHDARLTLDRIEARIHSLEQHTHE